MNWPAQSQRIASRQVFGHAAADLGLTSHHIRNGVRIQQVECHKPLADGLLFIVIASMISRISSSEESPLNSRATSSSAAIHSSAVRGLADSCRSARRASNLPRSSGDNWSAASNN